MKTGFLEMNIFPGPTDMMNDQISQIESFFKEEKFDDARKNIEKYLRALPPNSSNSFFLQIKLYGQLIDIGSASKNENDLTSAISFFEVNEKEILTHITKSSYYYNLANAKHSLSEIYWKNHPGVPAIKIIEEQFQEPIRLYWLALKNLGENQSELFLQILINLSNALVYSSRIVESLQFLDMVLNFDSDFPQALISRGDNLHWLSRVSNCPMTISFYAQIYKSYDKGIKTSALPQSILSRSLEHLNQALGEIQSAGFNEESIETELQVSQNEFNDHSDFRKYCINNFLTLNEHSIYCNCVATKKDDLQIGVPHAVLEGKIVPQLELLLNRIKSEFALSRWLYYQSFQENVEYDALFSELMDGEVINSKTEMQRTSFRLCYGILDKIALGICKLYGLGSKKIHFESFWQDKKYETKLNHVRNIHLNALFSIACDLNTKSGELKHFKRWRNDLEHNLLVLKNISNPDSDLLDIFSDKDFVDVADADDFGRKTLHLLQLTRSAIFSYVFCVRLQTIQARERTEKESFTVNFK